jgi:hypothetical protein
MPSNTYQPLMLGNVTFYRFEVPEELPNLFGTQKMAIHDAAGGDRTVQLLGAFPFPEIQWTGTFFQGDVQQSSTSSPMQRASQLNTFRTTGQLQQLTWGPFQYQVLVKEFEVMGKMAQQLNYKIVIVPVFDQTTTSNLASTPITPTGAVIASNLGVINATSFSTVLLLPSQIIAAAISITTFVNLLLTNNNGNISLVPQVDLAAADAQITALQTTLVPFINSSDYGQATGAATLSTSLSTLSTTLNIGQSTNLTTITVTNPNLPQLAQQYYGDATLWPLIASANNFQDMLPIGTFTLVIPPDTTQSSLIPIT